MLKNRKLNKKEDDVMDGLQRDSRIKLNSVGENKWEIQDKDGNLLVDGDNDYLIYMQNVNFRNGDSIEGRYLGTIGLDSVLLKVDNSKFVTTNGNEFLADGERVGTARMVVVNNKTSVTIVISNDL